MKKRSRAEKAAAVEFHQVETLADVHVHLREPNVMGDLIKWSIEGGADVLGPMPNTNVPLTTAVQVGEYIWRAKNMVPQGRQVTFIPIVMLTEATTEEEITHCVSNGIVDGKVYPRFRTTKSDAGVVNYGRLIPIIKACGRLGMKVHLHPEHPSPLFINREAEFSFLTIMKIFLEETEKEQTVFVWEHGTDANCILHWEAMGGSERFFVTLTAHHLITNEDETFGDVRAVCKPPIKTLGDQMALCNFVAKNHPYVMAGSDSAFHPETAKQVMAGRCACGAFTAPSALELYATALETLLYSASGRRTFVNFTSRNARRLHNLPVGRKVMLQGNYKEIPLQYKVGSEKAVPFWAGQKTRWTIVR